jgi:hypothetical protein
MSTPDRIYDVVALLLESAPEGRPLDTLSALVLAIEPDIDRDEMTAAFEMGDGILKALRRRRAAASLEAEAAETTGGT